MLYYAASTGGFYDTAVNARIPGDAVPVSYAQWRKCITDQAEGKIIVPDKVGKPMTIEDDRTVDGGSVLSFQAAAALAASDRRLLEFVEQGLPVPKEWRAYRETLRGIITGEAKDDKLPPVPDTKK